MSHTYCVRLVALAQDILASGGHAALPWYLYAAGGSVLVLAGKTIGKIAQDMITAMEKEEGGTGGGEKNTTGTSSQTVI